MVVRDRALFNLSVSSQGNYNYNKFQILDKSAKNESFSY